MSEQIIETPESDVTPDGNELDVEAIKAENEKMRKALEERNKENAKRRAENKQLKEKLQELLHEEEGDQPDGKAADANDPISALLQKVETLEQVITQDRDTKAREAKREKIKAAAEKLGFEHPEDAHLYTGTNMDEADIVNRLQKELEVKPYLKKKLPKTDPTNPGNRRPDQSDKDFLEEFLFGRK